VVDDDRGRARTDGLVEDGVDDTVGDGGRVDGVTA
jgi:hypothetical protein